MSKTNTKGNKDKKADKTDKTKKEETQEEFEEMTGEGKFVYPNKAIYIGQFKQLKTGIKIKEGKGKLLKPGFSILNEKGKENKDKNTTIGIEYYDGDWKNDKMDGYGVYHYSNGDVYEGHWVDGYQNGTGKYIFMDGTSYEGEWKNQKMDGTGNYMYQNNSGNFTGEFRNGNYFSKDQPTLKEEKRVQKIYEVLNNVPKVFQKDWEDTIANTDPKAVNDSLALFFCTQDNMGKYFNNLTFPQFDDYKPKYWIDTIKWIFEEEKEKQGGKKGKEEEEPTEKLKINIPKSAQDTIALPKDTLLAPQLQNELDNGQVVELIASVKDKVIKLVLGYNREMNKWLIVSIDDNKAPAKETKKKK